MKDYYAFPLMWPDFKAYVHTIRNWRKEETRISGYWATRESLSEADVAQIVSALVADKRLPMQSFPAIKNRNSRKSNLAISDDRMLKL